MSRTLLIWRGSWSEFVAGRVTRKPRQRRRARVEPVPVAAPAAVEPHVPLPVEQLAPAPAVEQRPAPLATRPVPPPGTVLWIDGKPTRVADDARFERMTRRVAERNKRLASAPERDADESSDEHDEHDAGVQEGGAA